MCWPAGTATQISVLSAACSAVPQSPELGRRSCSIALQICRQGHLLPTSSDTYKNRLLFSSFQPAFFREADALHGGVASGLAQRLCALYCACLLRCGELSFPLFATVLLKLSLSRSLSLSFSIFLSVISISARLHTYVVGHQLGCIFRGAGVT